MKHPWLYYAIITGTRTGSSHLCDLLESTNRLGSPTEYFNPDWRKLYESKFPNTEHSFTDKIMWFSKKENFVVGVKLNDITQLYTAFKEGMGNRITHWIWLRRCDKVAQAVSRYIAWETDVWDCTELHKRPPVQYSKERISNVLKGIVEEEMWIELFLRDKKFIELQYETDVCESPDQAVTSILDFLNVPQYDLPQLASKQLVMTTDLNTEFIKRFKAEK